jgi:uncharacterized protein (TIGR03086 family)
MVLPVVTASTPWVTDRGSADLLVLRSCVRHFLEVCGHIGPNHWVLPTPCDDWTLQELVDHVVGGNRFTLQVLGGATSDAAIDATMASFAEGGATAEDARSSMTAMEAAFRGPDVLDARFDHVVGELTGRQMLCLRLQDVIVHTWDLAHSLTIDTTLPADLVEWGTRELARSGSSTIEHFGVDQRAAGDEPATAEARYLANFNR